jgi:hypothetical protein
MHMETSIAKLSVDPRESIRWRSARRFRIVSHHLVQTVAVVVLLVAITITGSGTNVAYAGSNQQVPFNGSYSGTVAITGETTAVLSGSGTATHMGIGPYQGNVSDITATADGFSDVLVETLTAANGDTLTLRCDQVAVQTSPGVFVGNDTWTVIGGTGRFAGASGQGAGVTQIDLNLGVFDKRLDGTISAPNSN